MSLSFRTVGIALLAFLLTSIPFFAFAQEGIIKNPLQSQDILQLLMAFVRGVARIGALFLVLVLVWVGFQFAAAQGNEEKIRGARNMLLWTVVGGAILLGAELIADIVIATGTSLTP